MVVVIPNLGASSGWGALKKHGHGNIKLIHSPFPSVGWWGGHEKALAGTGGNRPKPLALKSISTFVLRSLPEAWSQPLAECGREAKAGQFLGDTSILWWPALALPDCLAKPSINYSATFGACMCHLPPLEMCLAIWPLSHFTQLFPISSHKGTFPNTVFAWVIPLFLLPSGPDQYRSLYNLQFELRYFRNERK